METLDLSNTELKHLYLSGNLFKTMPPKLKPLPDLEYIGVGDNLLTKEGFYAFLRQFPLADIQ